MNGLKIKLLLFSALFIGFIYLNFPSLAIASGDFNIDTKIQYNFLSSGDAEVTHEIVVENQISTIQAKSYSMTLQNVNPKDINTTDANGNSYIYSKSVNGDKTTIKIDFPDDVIGKGAVRKFYLKFLSSAYSNKYGEIFELNIPKLSDSENFRNYTVEVHIPLSFGKKSYISPEPYSENIKDNKYIYIFSKNIMVSSAISAAFGDFQVFDFSINYHLENPLSKLGETEIAFPPDTSFQKIFYKEIDPKPLEIRKDADGNWLGRYILSPRQKLDIKAIGSVKIFSKGITMNNNLDNEYQVKTRDDSEYWQSNDPTIIALANDLKTPKNIYYYVVNKLSYNYDKVNPNSDRLGALKALQEPNNAICMEFTDLFIALARSAGIPAREINGYAYAEDPKVQPMSLVNDVLHAWPEYYNQETGLWTPIDPTWGKTTGGEDFFNKLDLRHFTFVIHGLSSTKPYPPGSYKLGDDPQKDVYVSFGKLPEIKSPEIVIKNNSLQIYYLPGKKIRINIKNNSGFTVENENVTVNYDNNEKYRFLVPEILPYSSYDISFDYPFSLFGKNTPKIISINFVNDTFTIDSVKKVTVILSLLLVFGVISIFLLLYILFIKRAYFMGKLKNMLNKKNYENRF